MNAYYVFTCNFAHIFIVTFMEKLNHANSNVVHTKLVVVYIYKNVVNLSKFSLFCVKKQQIKYHH